MAEPWWHVALEVMGGAAATVALLTGLGVLFAKWRNVTFILPMQRGDRENQDQLKQIKAMLGINGKTIVEQMAEHMDTIASEAAERDRALHARLDQMQVSEMLHRTQGFAIAKMQHAAATQAGIAGWPDPEHFRGMLGTEQPDAASDDT